MYLSLEPAKFSKSRSRSKSAEVQAKAVEQKLGPREIGRVKDWKVITINAFLSSHIFDHDCFPLHVLSQQNTV